MLGRDPEPGNPTTIDAQSAPPSGGTEGPGNAGKRPGGTEPAAGPGDGPGPGAGPSPTGRLCAENPSGTTPMPLTKPSRKCSPAERIRRAWCRPPLLTGGPQPQTGIQTHLERISTTIDWLNATGRLDGLEAVRRLIRATWPTMAPPESVPPRKAYEFTDRYAALGIELSWATERVDEETGEATEGGFWLSLPGTAWASLGPDAQYRLAYQLRALGVRPTRLDLAVDANYAQPSDHLERMYAGSRGIERGAERRQPEVMGFGAMVQHDKHRWGDKLGRTINFGARGKAGGGRQLCVYDKGMEQGSADPGRWIRYEMRWFKRGQLATKALDALLENPDDWRRTALDMVLAEVDFRVANGRRERARRPRCAWWSAFLTEAKAIARERLHAVRIPMRLERTINWMQTAAMPTLTELHRLVASVDNLSGVTVGRIVDTLLDAQLMADPKKAEGLAEQFRELADDESSPIAQLLAQLRTAPPWQPA